VSKNEAFILPPTIDARLTLIADKYGLTKGDALVRVMILAHQIDQQVSARNPKVRVDNWDTESFITFDWHDFMTKK
jgi:hypothetical protein